jgi:hypothetical protein
VTGQKDKIVLSLISVCVCVCVCVCMCEWCVVDLLFFFSLFFFIWKEEKCGVQN